MVLHAKHVLSPTATDLPLRGNAAKPGLLDLKGRKKWDAWASKKGKQLRAATGIASGMSWCSPSSAGADLS